LFVICLIIHLPSYDIQFCMLFLALLVRRFFSFYACHNMLNSRRAPLDNFDCFPQRYQMAFLQYFMSTHSQYSRYKSCLSSNLTEG
jgi:hypothetical protein